MTALILGLLIFLGLHSLRVFADGWRSRTRARVGENVYKGLYSLLAVLGLALIIWGWGAARQHPVLLWSPAPWTRHLAALLMLPALVMLIAAYVPGNAIKARLHHPMVLGVKTWALAHLLANGLLSHVLLFGSFLVWAVLCFGAARQRDRAASVVYPPGRVLPTVVTVLVGVAAWALIAFWAHGALIGVRPFG